MDIRSVFRPAANSRIAFVGAGGKTTALFRLADEIDGPVVITTTTHIGADQLNPAFEICFLDAEESLINQEKSINWGGKVFISRPPEAGKVAGLDADNLDFLHEICARRDIPILIEADGSKRRPLKAPAGHEPVIPKWATDIAVVAGLSGLGKPLGEEFVHHPELYTALTGGYSGEVVKNSHLAAYFNATGGGLKNIPESARRYALLNQADLAPSCWQSAELIKIIAPNYDSVCIANLTSRKRYNEVLRTSEPIAGVVLAAGESRRYGAVKQLLTWDGETLVHHQARIALESGLAPVAVVVGSHAPQIRQAVEDLEVEIIENANWEAGQGTSVQVGARFLSRTRVGGAIYLLCDQPQVDENLLRQLVEKHAIRAADIIAPEVDRKRANPVLFDRSLFAELETVPAEQGGRHLFTKHPVERLPWSDERLLLDIDFPEDYKNLKKMYEN